VSDPYAQAASLVAATIEYCGGPYCGQTHYVVGPVPWMRCYYDCDDETSIHVYKLARSDVDGHAVFLYFGVAK
jgi:hypothetical protein